MQGKAEVDVKGQVVNRCPCGCQPEDLDEYGYCHHLVGFTNDGKSFDVLEPLPDFRGNRVVNGRKRGQVDRKRHLLVNPEELSKEGTIRKMWVSARVYDRDAKRPETKPEMAQAG